MMQEKYDFIIVGSGAGGATLAKELAGKGKSIAVFEKGKKQENFGSFFDCLRYYDLSATKLGRKSRERNVLLWRAFMEGGSTGVSCGNGVRCLEQELSELGINLESEFEEAESEMGIKPFDLRRLSSGGKKILQASKDLGYRMEPMPKFIDFTLCRRCGKCQYGCPHHARWTVSEYLEIAKQNGADIFDDSEVQNVVIENGTVKGVSLRRRNNHSMVKADTVILSAGGIATPILLQRAGFEQAGQSLFMDLLVNTYGISKELNQTGEPTMSLVDHEFYRSDGFILSPFIQSMAIVRFLELGIKGLLMPKNRQLGIMTKISDDSVGRVYPDGSFSKTITASDKKKLEKGSSIARQILEKVGVDRKTITVSVVNGAHPGGTAAIGELVDTNLQTEANNLFICDGSVLPKAPGMPPMLTIIALSKRLAKFLQ